MRTISQFNKKLTALALLTITSVGGTILVVNNASAQNKPPDVTLWDAANGKGASFKSNSAVPDLSRVGFNDKASSVVVSNGQKWRFYQNKDFKGSFVEVGPGPVRVNLGGLNNQISSFKSVK